MDDSRADHRRADDEETTARASRRDECGDEDASVDLVAALARARSPEVPGPATSAGPPGRRLPGPPRSLAPGAGAGLDLGTLLRLSLAASDASGRLRPTPSAGALHPVDAELLVGADCSLPAGRYAYDPLRHRAHRLGRCPDPTSRGVRVELTVTARRTVSHYGHRAWPLLLLDTGHAAAALLLAARATGAGEPEVDLDTGAERPLAVVRVPPPEDSGPRDGAPRSRPTPRELLGRRSAPPPLLGSPPPEALREILATAAEAGGSTLRWCVAVGGDRPGLLEPAADGGAPRRRATGEARPTLAVWAAGQAWLRDAGAVLLAHGCPDDADAPHIRRAHLRAGFAVHQAHVAARRHGAAARPVGSWQGADLGAALGAAPGRDRIVHGLALGTRHAHEESIT